jgi:hypothetical protein
LIFTEGRKDHKGSGLLCHSKRSEESLVEQRRVRASVGVNIIYTGLTLSERLMQINGQKIRAVLALPAPKRYSHFIKVVADQRKGWGLFRDGWALAGTNEGKEVFPLWPAQEYASLCAIDGWAGHEARDIDLDTLFEILLPKLAQSGTLIGIFPTPDSKGITPDPKQLEDDLREELAKIE